MQNQSLFKPPVKTNSIALHSCCAPCSSGMIDYLITEKIEPVILYFNPNIFPYKEYILRKEENKRYAKSLGLTFVDADYNHQQWNTQVEHLKNEPERGSRCQLCFDIRMAETAKFASNNNIKLFATTLATSRWKNLDQINKAGVKASEPYSNVTFWANNWRRNGLAESQAKIIKKYDFYRQQYCGCEYSLRDSNQWRKENGKPLITPPE